MLTPIIQSLGDQSPATPATLGTNNQRTECRGMSAGGTTGRCLFTNQGPIKSSQFKSSQFDQYLESLSVEGGELGPERVVEDPTSQLVKLAVIWWRELIQLPP